MERLFLSVTWDYCLLIEVVHPELVQPQDMIGMSMRKKNRIHTGNFVYQGLMPQICRGINQKMAVFIFDPKRGTGADISRIGRGADRTDATDGRNPGRGPASKYR